MITEIILAAGCFWGVQSTFDQLNGIIKTEVGYAGGITKNPTYQNVSTGQTGHAESVKITYDAEQISTEEILDVFFQSHDPTTPNRQGPDVGTQYRSAVFYTTDEQKKSITDKIKEYQPFYKSPIVTEIKKIDVFYPAEDYHQKYCEKTGKNCKTSSPSFDKEKYYKSKLSTEQYKVLREKQTEKPYTAVWLENDYIRVMVLPELGGRIQRAYDKTNGYDFVYYNEVIKHYLGSRNFAPTQQLSETWIKTMFCTDKEEST